MTAVAAPTSKPRQLSHPELDQYFPINCTIDPVKRTVIVNATWKREMLKTLVIVPGKPSVLVHKDALPRFQMWLDLARNAGCLEDIETVDGGFVPRLMRGVGVPATTAGLSRHTLGIAVDVNALTNMRGTRGAAFGQKGCVRRLVPLAYQCGLVWGGDWNGEKCDPMHFEIGKSA